MPVRSTRSATLSSASTLRHPIDVLGVSSLSFDLSVFDIFGTLSAGATLVLPGNVAHLRCRCVGGADPRDRRDHLEFRAGIDATADQLLHGQRHHRRVVPARGHAERDWIPTWLPDRVRGVAPDARVISLGGATEASIWSVFYEIDEVDPAGPASRTAPPCGTRASS